MIGVSGILWGCDYLSFGANERHVWSQLRYLTMETANFPIFLTSFHYAGAGT